MAHLDYERQLSKPVTRLEKVLLIIAAVIWLVAAISPTNRLDWLVENVMLIVGVTWVLMTYRVWRLSELSYVLIFLFFVLHTIGAHYTYAAVPIGKWVQQALGRPRNDYDRLVHFLFGLLLVYPFRDQILRASRSSRNWGSLVAFMVITSLSAIYEILEWLVAEIAQPTDALAFLGTQGDVFDAQKDVAVALLGAVFTLLLTSIAERRHARRIAPAGKNR